MGETWIILLGGGEGVFTFDGGPLVILSINSGESGGVINLGLGDCVDVGGDGTLLRESCDDAKGYSLEGGGVGSFNPSGGDKLKTEVVTDNSECGE